MIRKYFSLTIIVFVCSTLIATAQMQMPSDKPEEIKSSQSSEQKTLTGTVSDSMCGAHHMAKDKSPAECTRMCVKQGNKYALVAGTKVYTLKKCVAKNPSAAIGASGRFIRASRCLQSCLQVGICRNQVPMTCQGLR